MSGSRNSNHTGRNPETSSKDISNAGGHSIVTQRSPSKRKVEERAAQTKTQETDLLIEEAILKGIIRRKAKGVYDISLDMCSRLIQNIWRAGLDLNYREKAIIESVWYYYGFSHNPKVRRKVSIIAKIVERMTFED